MMEFPALDALQKEVSQLCEAASIARKLDAEIGPNPLASYTGDLKDEAYTGKIKEEIRKDLSLAWSLRLHPSVTEALGDLNTYKKVLRALEVTWLALGPYIPTWDTEPVKGQISTLTWGHVEYFFNGGSDVCE